MSRTSDVVDKGKSQQVTVNGNLKFIAFNAAKQRVKHKSTTKIGLSKYRSSTAQCATDSVYGSSSVLVLEPVVKSRKGKEVSVSVHQSIIHLSVLTVGKG